MKYVRIMRVSMDKNDENREFEDKEKIYRALRAAEENISPARCTGNKPMIFFGLSVMFTSGVPFQILSELFVIGSKIVSNSYKKVCREYYQLL